MQNLPSKELDKDVEQFLETYGEMRVSGINLSCDNLETKQYRKMTRILSKLKMKAKEIGVSSRYEDVFSSFSGITIYSSTC